MSGPKFPVGRIVATANALQHLPPGDILAGLLRHITGDWGDIGIEDRKENEMSLHKGFRLVSAYYAANHIRFWIITEADRSVTTVLLPEDD